MSDLIGYPILVFPQILTELYTDSWLVSGPLGQALCKLVFVLEYVSSSVSIQSLVLIAVDRFVAVVFPLRSPLINDNDNDNVFLFKDIEFTIFMSCK